MVVKKKVAPKSAAAKKAMAERGTFEREAAAEAYSHLVHTAVKPYVAASERSVGVWGDTLVGFVPPAFAVRHQELKELLDVAMREGQHVEAQRHAQSLIKALEVMDDKARADGHQPPVVDGYLCKHGDSVYCFLASGSLREVRSAHPKWLVYHVSDVCAVLAGKFAEMQAEVANNFPDARVVKFTATTAIVEDVDFM
tara:strand:- start:308 stop:898 length:591 start_codon:yes stop_codon:yes gene_type:complete